jgi:tRNA U34 2-thiouridine synthase MnmA/TrmU
LVRTAAPTSSAEPALVAPGQAASLYRDDDVIGGGIVDRPPAA